MFEGLDDCCVGLVNQGIRGKETALGSLGLWLQILQTNVKRKEMALRKFTCDYRLPIHIGMKAFNQPESF